jgi:hypothetical protein
MEATQQGSIMDEWVSKMWYIQTMENYSTLKRKEILLTVLVQACNSNTLEAEAGGSKVQVQSGLHGKTNLKKNLNK